MLACFKENAKISVPAITVVKPKRARSNYNSILTTLGQVFGNAQDGGLMW